MHQPWRTLASIINNCLSGKTTSNDRLDQSRVAVIWGMFHKKYVNYAELIREDFSYQIDNRQVHATHERIVTESDLVPARRRPSGIAFKDTSNVSKKKSPDSS
ncbi:hypothetical protein Tco_0714309 [Tanacetum coccineum]